VSSASFPQSQKQENKMTRTSTEIAKLETTSYDALDAAIGSDLDGEPLRFKDGKFLQGFDKNIVEKGTVLRIAPTSVQDGFVKWEDGKPVDWRLREWISSTPIGKLAQADIALCRLRVAYILCQSRLADQGDNQSDMQPALECVSHWGIPTGIVGQVQTVRWHSHVGTYQ
jgi:hypothetical protein